MKKQLGVFIILVLALSSATAPIFANSEDVSARTLTDSFRLRRWGTYELTVYYPVEAEEPCPAIVFAHGFLSCHQWSTWMGNLVKEGYIVLVFTVPDRASPDVEQWVQGIEGSIEYLTTENNRWFFRSPLYHKVDLNRIAVVGHSFGAMAALIAASECPEVKTAVIIEAPYLEGIETGNPSIDSILREMDWDRVYQAASDITIPVQFQVGTLDKLCNNSETYYDAVQSEKEFILIEDGNHVNYIDPIKATDATKELADLLFFDLPKDVLNMVLETVLNETSDIVGYLNLLKFLVPNEERRLNLLSNILNNILERAGLDITLIDVVLEVGLDNPTDKAPEEQQKETLRYIDEWFDRYLIE